MRDKHTLRKRECNLVTALKLMLAASILCSCVGSSTLDCPSGAVYPRAFSYEGVDMEYSSLDIADNIRTLVAYGFWR